MSLWGSEKENGELRLYSYMKDRLQSSSTDLGNIELLCFGKKVKLLASL